MNARVGAILVFAAMLAGCERPAPSYPLEPCDIYEADCTFGFECIGHRCIAGCTYEGDCDLGYRCVGNQCLQSCDDGVACTVGVCREVGDDRPGEACHLENLPDCVLDEHCGWGVCDDGTCLGRCDWPEECGFGWTCDFRNGDHGACVVSDVDVPPVEPTPTPPKDGRCRYYENPDLDCQAEVGPRGYCQDLTACAAIGWPAIVIVDESGPAACDATDPAPGSDIYGVFATGGVRPHLFVLGEGASNAHTDATVLQTYEEEGCPERPWVSLGCGGALVLVSDERVVFRPDAYFEVQSRQACFEQGEFAIFACIAIPQTADEIATYCDKQVGSTLQSSFELP